MQGPRPRGPWPPPPIVYVPCEDEGDHAAAAATWDEQVAEEQRTMDTVVAVLRGVRQSAVHRKLPHFHAVDRQLRTIEEQFELISMSLGLLALRPGRADGRAPRPAPPAARQVRRPGGTDTSLRGLRQAHGGPGLETPSEEAGAADDSLDADLQALGLVLLADREAVESAYRRRSRHFHRRGRCVNVRGFNALMSARNRCLARLSHPQLRAYGGGGDLVAHYLLMGTDPGESRYREYAVGILDVVHRGQLLQKIQVLQWPLWDIPLTWGDDADSLTYGGQSPWASG